MSQSSRLKSVDFEWRNPYSASKLAQAIRAGRINMVRRLIKKGFSLDAPDNRGWTPLHEVALSDNNIESCKLLISSGAFIEHKTVEGETPLYIAAKNESVEIVRALLEAGCEVNTQTNVCSTPLHIACSNRNEAIINLLIEAGANLNALDDDFSTPINFALDNLNTIALNTLISAGADLKTKDFSNRSPLQCACMIGNLEIFEILISALGHDRLVIDQQTPDGWSLLMEAVQHKNYLIAEKLIEYGTDTTLVNNQGLLALHVAAHSQRPNLIELLLKNTPKEAIEKYCTLQANMSSTRSLPCLAIDMNDFDGLTLFFEFGLSKDVLKCPVKMNSTFFSPVSFLLSHAKISNSKEKLRFCEFLLSYDFLVDPQYSLKVYVKNRKVVKPIVAAINMHYKCVKSCFCGKYLSLILEKGVCPDIKVGEYISLTLFKRTIWKGFFEGLDLLLQYSECVEPEDVLEAVFTERCVCYIELDCNQRAATEHLLSKCIPELLYRARFNSDGTLKWAKERKSRSYKFIVPVNGFICKTIMRWCKDRKSVSSLKRISRSYTRRYLREQSQALNIPFRTYIRNIGLPKPLLQYLEYDVEM